MTESRAKEIIATLILVAFDLLPEEKRSAAFAELAPKISSALFKGKMDTLRAMDVVKP